MDFGKPSRFVTPMATPHHEIPADDPGPGETGSGPGWLVTDPVIGPSNHMPAAPGSPSTIDPLSIATATRLAFTLNWKVRKPEA